MSQENELLNGLSEEELAAYSVSPETEPHIVIGTDRYITVPEKLKRLAVQFDHNIETVTFDCPRYWDGLDMSQMQIFINYVRADGVPGAYKAKNVVVDATDDTIMHFDWTIEGYATAVKGDLKFLVCTKKTDGEKGELLNHWNSELCTSCFVSEGLETEGALVVENLALITEMLTKMDSLSLLGSKVDQNSADVAQVATRMNSLSQGRHASYKISSSGWKRILNVIRANGGTVNLGLANGVKASDHKQVHTLAFDFSGFVKFPGQSEACKPVLLKRYENFFGIGEEKFKITGVRIGYPKDGTSFPDPDGIGKTEYALTPVNCYIDIYVEVDTSINRKTDFIMNYSGFSESHNCTPILEEKDVTAEGSDKGIYGEELTYYELPVASMPMYLTSDLLKTTMERGYVVRIDDGSATVNAEITTVPKGGIRVFGKNIMPIQTVGARRWITDIPPGTTLTASCADKEGLGAVSLVLLEADNPNAIAYTVPLDKTNDRGRRYGSVTTDKKVNYAMWIVEGGESGNGTIPYGQMEVSSTPTGYEDFMAYTYYNADEFGNVSASVIKGDTTTIIPEKQNEIAVSYFRDLGKFIKNIYSKL